MLLYGQEPSSEPVLEEERFDAPVGPDAAGKLREHLQETLERWGWDHCVDAATVCASEVATVLLAVDCAELSMTAARHAHHVTVIVRCGGAARRFADVVGADTSRARGLAMLDDLVSLWGVRPTGDGDAIWFELR